MAWVKARPWKACDLGARSMPTVAAVVMVLDEEVTICMERLCEDEEVVADLGVLTDLVDAVATDLHRVLPLTAS